MRVLPCGEHAALVELEDLTRGARALRGLRGDPPDGVDRARAGGAHAARRLRPGPCSPATWSPPRCARGRSAPATTTGHEVEIPVTLRRRGPRRGRLTDRADRAGGGRAAHRRDATPSRSAASRRASPTSSGSTDPLDVPRRDDPRTRVPAGAVALADEFTARLPACVARAAGSSSATPDPRCGTSSARRPRCCAGDAGAVRRGDGRDPRGRHAPGRWRPCRTSAAPVWRTSASGSPAPPTGGACGWPTGWSATRERRGDRGHVRRAWPCAFGPPRWSRSPARHAGRASDDRADGMYAPMHARAGDTLRLGARTPACGPTWRCAAASTSRRARLAEHRHHGPDSGRHRSRRRSAADRLRDRHLPGVDLAPQPPYADRAVLRVVLGPRDDWFAPEAVDDAVSAPYTVTPQTATGSGMRLDGPALARRITDELKPEATVTGALQVPPTASRSCSSPTIRSPAATRSSPSLRRRRPPGRAGAAGPANAVHSVRRRNSSKRERLTPIASAREWRRPTLHPTLRPTLRRTRRRTSSARLRAPRRRSAPRGCRPRHRRTGGR